MSSQNDSHSTDMDLDVHSLSEVVSSDSNATETNQQENLGDPGGEEGISLNRFLIGMELYNFKSYQGRQVVGPFTTLTGIIGPNGSGKSNLMDAISFALCIRLASKRLRTNRIANLINENSEFSSSAADSFIDSNWKAYVMLYFKDRNSNAITKIGRIILRDGTSRFVIEKQQYQSKEPYLRFLNRLGFNAKTKIFLFFQGMVDTLVTNNPKEFTHYLEEISGSSEYEKEYNSLKLKMNEEFDKLKLVEGVGKDLLKSKKLLSSLARQRTRNAMLNTEIQEMKINIFLLSLYKYCNEIKKRADNLESLKVSSEEIEPQIRELKMQRDQLSGNVQNLEMELDKFRNVYRDSDFSLCRKEKRDHTSVDKDIETCTRKLADARKNEAHTNNQRRDSMRRKAELQDLMNTLNNQISTVNQNINLQQLEITEEEVEEYHRLDVLFQSDLFIEESASIEQIKEIDLLKKELALNNDKINAIEMQIATLKLNVTQTMTDKIENEIDDHCKQMNDAKKNLDEKKKKLNKTISNLSELEKQLKDAQESLSRKYKTVTRNEKIKQSQQFVDNLKLTFPDEVYGRFCQIVKPKNSRYKTALSRVGKQYNNAIIVKSFNTILKIRQTTEGKLFSTEIFIAVDDIKAPKLQEKLRHIKLVNGRSTNDVHLIYDLVEFNDEMKKMHKENPNLEKAIRFVYGNTLVCPDLEMASAVAYNLGDDRTYNAVSLDGASFQRNGRISSNLTSNEVRNDSWDHSDYAEEKANVDRLKIKYNSLNDSKLKEEEEFRSGNGDFFRLVALLGIGKKRKEDLLNKEAANKRAISDMYLKIRDFNTKANLLQAELEEKIQALGRFDDRVAQIEARHFRGFLTRHGFKNIKDFETRFYGQHKDDFDKLEKLDNELKKLQNEKNYLNAENYEESLQRWRRVIQKCELELKRLQALKGKYEKKFLSSNKNLEACLEKSNESREQYQAAKSAYDRVKAELSRLEPNFETLQQSAAVLISKLNQLRKARHDVFKKAYLDAIDLPMQNDFLYHSIIASEEDDQEEDGQLYKREDEILPLFDEIEQFIPNFESNSIIDENAFNENMFELERKLQQKEEDYQKLTVSADGNLNEKINRNNEKIKTNTRKIQQARNKYAKAREHFEKVKEKRTRMFQSFLDKVGTNLDRYYKELNNNASSQAFLIPENPEEPYLAGIQYSCIVPGKSFQPISSLSGGEKSLAAFAFVFSCYSEQLPSFFILDEIDGPLDNDNIAKLMDFVRAKLAETQFIFISHKLELFGRTDSLIGVCREKNGDTFQSKTYSLNISQ